MATEKRLIDANALTDTIEGIDWYHIDKMGYLVHGANSAEHTPLYKAESIYHAIKNAPTVDAVSRGVHDQVRWERDVAIQQLEEHGIPFGGIAPDVVKVVHGRWERWGTFDDLAKCSVCGAGSYTLHFVYYHNFKYCPNCGAKMDGDLNG